MAERDRDQRIAIGVRADAGIPGIPVRTVTCRAMNPILPQSQLFLTRGRRRGAFVGDVVGKTGKRVDGGNVRTHRRRQQPRRDGEILVMRSRERFAGCVGAGKRIGPE